MFDACGALLVCIRIWHIYVSYCFYAYCSLNCLCWVHKKEMKCCQNLHLNVLFFMFWKFWFLSVRTETEPNYLKPKSLGSEFYEEPISSRFAGNRINRITKEPNRSVSVNRMPRVSRHPPLRLVQHPHAQPLQDLRPVSPLTQSRASICPLGL
jgi:hypothetical protein